MPAVSWEVKLYDRRDRLVGEKSIPDLVDKNFSWTQQSKVGQPDLGSYQSVLAMVYGRTAWEVMRRAGLKAGPPPTVFP